MRKGHQEKMLNQLMGIYVQKYSSNQKKKVRALRNQQRQKVITVACECMKRKAEQPTMLTSNSKPEEKQDECHIFGLLIAQKLRLMNNITRQYVMHDIHNIMFKAIIGNNSYSRSATSS